MLCRVGREAERAFIVFMAFIFAVGLSLAPTQASAANCDVSKKEKIAMV
jgi:hypothetical protein